MTLENSLEVWAALVRSGLEETRRNHLPGYDAELVAVLKERLYPHATHNLERELRAAPPSTEAFLEVFFGALKPFSGMLCDVLGMFEAAGARRSDENLRLAFDFDKASKELVLTLQEFREAEAFLRRVARPIVERRWNSNTLFLLSQDVQSVLASLGVHDPRERFDEQSRVRDPHVCEWVRRNGRPAWEPFPGFPRSGVTELDRALEMAEGLIRYLMTEVRKLGSTYEEFARQLGELPWEEEDDDAKGAEDDAADERPRRAFVMAAHDYWANSFADNVCLAIEAVNGRRSEEKSESAAQLAAAIWTGLDRPPRHERTRVSLEQDFRDLINLPIWKKRHELYAVWIASRIADALRELSWEWHPDGDTLRFPFAGVELATLRSADGGTHILWTEKRTALKGAGILGRKHIQPDYRIMTVPTHREDATSLVVECKQYRKWNKRNFGTALDDYAKGCPKATVILVNYGPTDPGILDVVDSSRRDRTFLVGDFKPGGDAAFDGFRDLLRSAYTSLLTPRITGPIVLELGWGPVFRDLDLHLFIRPIARCATPQHIGFGSIHGSLMDLPWAEWPQDITDSPPGLERTTIAQWLDAEYDILVHDFSGTPKFPQGDVTLRMILDSSVEACVFTPPNEKEGRWWHVCRIHGPTGQVEEINSIETECPYRIS